MGTAGGEHGDDDEEAGRRKDELSEKMQRADQTFPAALLFKPSHNLKTLRCLGESGSGG